LRGLAIAAVVMIHTAWGYAIAAGLDRQAGRVAVALHLTAGFAVPLFVVLSAVGLSLGYGRRLSMSEYVDFIRRRALRLLPAYVVWSILSIAAFKPHVFGSPAELARTILHGRADAQFYYIPLVFELYVLWPVFQPLARASARSGAAAMAIAIAGFAASASWWQFTAWRPFLQGTEFSIVVWLLYVCLGIAMGPRLTSVKSLAARNAVIAALTLLTVIAAYFMYENFVGRAAQSSFQPPGLLFAAMIFQIPSTAYITCAIITASLLAFRYAHALGPLFITLGRHAYGIFLIHLLVLRLGVQRALPPTNLTTASTTAVVATVVLAWVTCIATSSALVAAASRLPALRPLVSHRW